MFWNKSILVVFTLVFAVLGDIQSKDTTNSLSSAVNEAQEEFGLPPGIQNIMSLPEINEGEDMFREKCLKNGHNESFDQYIEAKREFEDCVASLIDVKQLQSEIKAAKPTGDLDIVFKKYCGKTPIVKGCAEKFMKASESCFAEKERSQLDVVQNVTDSLMNFICFKEGDRIALFIAEGGPECLTSKAEAVQRCVNSTVASAQGSGPAQNISTEDIPEILFDSEKCGYFTQIQKCVVQVLEECSEPTPANIVGSLFDFVRKSTPCSQFNKTSGGSSSFLFSAMSFILPIGAIVLSKI